MSSIVRADRGKISNYVDATFYVESDEPVYAYEARAIVRGQTPTQGTGINLLEEEGLCDENGVVTLQTPVTEFSFTVTASEILTEGAYDVYVFLKYADGWQPEVDISGGSSGGGSGMEEEE